MMRHTSEERDRKADVEESRERDAQPEALNDRLLAMQQRAGNSSVKAFVQTKLEVGDADDAYEREADEIATSVLGHASGASGGHGGGEGGKGFTASPQLGSFVGRG